MMYRIAWRNRDGSQWGSAPVVFEDRVQADDFCAELNSRYPHREHWPERQQEQSARR